MFKIMYLTKRINIQNIFKSVTSIQIVLLLPFYSRKTDPFYLFTVLNLFISSLYHHSCITYFNHNYENKYVKTSYDFDKFSILLICVYFTFNLRMVSVLLSLILKRYENVKNFFFLLTIFTNIYYKNWLAPIFAILAMLCYKKRLVDDEWTLQNKILWHAFNAFYLCSCSYKYLKT